MFIPYELEEKQQQQRFPTNPSFLYLFSFFFFLQLPLHTHPSQPQPRLPCTYFQTSVFLLFLPYTWLSFFIYNFVYLSVYFYFWLCRVFVAARPFPGLREGSSSPLVACGLLTYVVGSLAANHGLQARGLQQLQLMDSGLSPGL